MKKDGVIELLKTLGEKGQRRWNELRRDHSIRLDLTGIDLSGLRLQEINFTNCDLAGAKFQDSDLESSIFVNCNLHETDFSRANCEHVNFSDSDLKEAWLSGANLRNAKVHKSNCVGKKFDSSINLRAIRLAHSDFEGVEFAGCDLDSASISNTSLKNVSFSNVRLNSANLSQTNLNGASFNNCQLKTAQFGGSDLTGAIFRNCEIQQASFQEIKQSQNVKFENSNLTGAKLNLSVIKNSFFHHCILRDTMFQSADLSGTDFRFSVMNVGTTFTKANVDRVTIEKHTLESLENYGSLMPGDRMRMNIIDDVATLRSSYSGFWQWVHVIAMTIFVSPYLWFVMKHWGTAQLTDHLSKKPQTIKLLHALARYVYSGGGSWHGEWKLAVFPFAAFVFALVYNVVRFVLLAKTKKLELQEQTTGLPAVFSLAGGWRTLYIVAKAMFWLNLCVVAYHTIHFMLQDIPIR